MNRERTRGVQYNSGYLERISNGSVYQTSNGAPTTSYYDFCSDFIGTPVADSPFTSRQFEGELPYVDGEFSGGPLYPNNTCKLYHYSHQIPTGFYPSNPIQAPAGWMLDLIAGTNPSRPVLTIPEAIENIAQLPKMLKGLGEAILNPKSRASPKGLAGEYLGVQFGWLPLIGDLQKLLDVQSYVDKRNKELDQLYSGKGLRRRLSFGDTTTVNHQTYIDIIGAGLPRLRHRVSVEIKRKAWGTIRWYPTSPPLYHPDDASQNAYTTKLILGATPEAMANGLWKVIPWTWLIGWFTNVGKYTLANSWSVPANHGKCCFMSQIEVKAQSASVTGTTIVQMKHAGTAKSTYKSRLIGTQATAGVNIPYLDMFRLSILGSLFTQRFVR